MDSTALLARFRLDTRDTGFPPLWSDAEIYSYADEAQKMFCRLTGGLADATSQAAKLKAKAGNPFANISSRVLKLRSAFGADGRKLTILNMEDLEFSLSRGTELFADVAGPISSLVVGMEPNRVKIINTPETDQTINLIIYRMPLDDITASGQELEIDEVHHLALLKWMRHLAHLKTDAETYDRGRAVQFDQEFREYCDMAKLERGAREHKYRTVGYGGY